MAEKREIPTTTSAPADAAKQVSPTTYMKNTVINVTSELKEKEKRKQNVMVYGLREPVSQNIEAATEEDKGTF